MCMSKAHVNQLLFICYLMYRALANEPKMDREKNTFFSYHTKTLNASKLDTMTSVVKQFSFLVYFNL